MDVVLNFFKGKLKRDHSVIDNKMFDLWLQKKNLSFLDELQNNIMKYRLLQINGYTFHQTILSFETRYKVDEFYKYKSEFYKYKSKKIYPKVYRFCYFVCQTGGEIKDTLVNKTVSLFHDKPFHQVLFTTLQKAIHDGKNTIIDPISMIETHINHPYIHDLITKILSDNYLYEKCLQTYPELIWLYRQEYIKHYGFRIIDTGLVAGWVEGGYPLVTEVKLLYFDCMSFFQHINDRIKHRRTDGLHSVPHPISKEDVDINEIIPYIFTCYSYHPNLLFMFNETYQYFTKQNSKLIAEAGTRQFLHKQTEELIKYYANRNVARPTINIANIQRLFGQDTTNRQIFGALYRYCFYHLSFDGQIGNIYDSFAGVTVAHMQSVDIKSVLKQSEPSDSDNSVVCHPITFFKTYIDHPDILALIKQFDDRDLLPTLHIEYPYTYKLINETYTMTTPLTPLLTPLNIPPNYECSTSFNNINWKEMIKVCEKYKYKNDKEFKTFQTSVNNILLHGTGFTSDRIYVDLKGETLLIISDYLFGLDSQLFPYIPSYERFYIHQLNVSGRGYGHTKNLITITIDWIKNHLFEKTCGGTFFISPKHPDMDNINNIYYKAGRFLLFCIVNDINLNFRFCYALLCKLFKIKPTKHERIWHYIKDAQQHYLLNLLKEKDLHVDLDDTVLTTTESVKSFIDKKAREHEKMVTKHSTLYRSFISGFRSSYLFNQALSKISLPLFNSYINRNTITENKRDIWVETVKNDTTNTILNCDNIEVKNWMIEIIQESEVVFVEDLLWFWTSLRQFPDETLHIKIKQESSNLPESATCFYNIYISNKYKTKQNLKEDLVFSIEESKKIKSVFDD